ncbi:MAG: iron-containing alcohol dehydrogenase [Candidatus Heimdallarchaeota archaeon]|nr:iron-containing alcohol dehydrogenase [Candidatus Heimdallarchaeota archaeon]
MWYFCSPRKIAFGEEALEALREVHAKKALVVTDATLLQLGTIQPVLDLLKEESVPFVIFSAIQPEPAIPPSREGAKLAEQEGIDLIIAVGGGSVIDGAKAIWVFYENLDLDIAEVFPEDPLVLRQKAGFIAIPTTSGTGSDANWAIVIKNPETKQKLSLAHRELIPDLAIVDPQFTKALPLDLTAATAFDALTHAIEAFTVEWRNDFSDGLALQALKLIFEFLPQVMTDKDNVVAREKLHNAATMAGLAFGNSQIGGVHALAHSLGAVLSLPHAQVVAVVLPHMMHYCLSEPIIEQRYTEIAYTLRLVNTFDAKGAHALIDKIEEFRNAFGLKTKLSDFGVTKNLLEEKMPLIIEFALNDTGSLVNPKELNNKIIRTLCFAML